MLVLVSVPRQEIMDQIMVWADLEITLIFPVRIRIQPQWEEQHWYVPTTCMTVKPWKLHGLLVEAV